MGEWKVSLIGPSVRPCTRFLSLPHLVSRNDAKSHRRTSVDDTAHYGRARKAMQECRSTNRGVVVCARPAKGRVRIASHPPAPFSLTI